MFMAFQKEWMPCHVNEAILRVVDSAPHNFVERMHMERAADRSLEYVVGSSGSSEAGIIQ